MKALICILLIGFVGEIAAAQNTRPSVPSQVESKKIVELPNSKIKFRPKISLQKALKIAEAYIDKNKINVSEYYLGSVTLIMYGEYKNPKEKDSRTLSWHFVWGHEAGALGNYIELIISTETGDVLRIPSM